MGRDCAEWQGTMAMDAIGLATERESRDLREHVASCLSCRQDAADLLSAAGALRSVDPAQVGRLEPQLPTEAAAAGGQVEAAPAEPFSYAGADTEAGHGRKAGHLSQSGPRARGRRRRRLAGGVGALVAAAAAITAVVALGGAPAPPSRTMALRGQPGVVASIALTSQSWGTRGTLRESGQAPGQVLTVAMKSASGRWWVAGSYRTAARSGTLEVQLSCAVALNQVTDVWVTDQSGQVVLNAYVGEQHR
ncbi:MAG TPA: hypothetical protein VGY51_10555 [Acidimicrobiales bacterium]|nr:hypothetical protein [Acidimicrobiales bacterium]